jgi:hypothetical protein
MKCKRCEIQGLRNEYNRGLRADGMPYERWFANVFNLGAEFHPNGFGVNVHAAFANAELRSIRHTVMTG